MNANRVELQFGAMCKTVGDALYWTRLAHVTLVVWVLSFSAVSMLPAIGMWWITVVSVGLLVTAVLGPLAMMTDRMYAVASKAEQLLFERYRDTIAQQIVSAPDNIILQLLLKQTDKDLLHLNTYKRRMFLIGCYSDNDLYTPLPQDDKEEEVLPV